MEQEGGGAEPPEPPHFNHYLLHIFVSFASEFLRGCVVAVVSKLCAALSCDQLCEVVMTPSGVSEARCVCTVGYTRVAVTESRRCSSQLLSLSTT